MKINTKINKGKGKQDTGDSMRRLVHKIDQYKVYKIARKYYNELQNKVQQSKTRTIRGVRPI